MSTNAPSESPGAVRAGFCHRRRRKARKLDRAEPHQVVEVDDAHHFAALDDQQSRDFLADQLQRLGDQRIGGAMVRGFRVITFSTGVSTSGRHCEVADANRRR